MPNPVAARASSGSARRASEAPASVASRLASARLAPEVSANNGVPSATNTRDFTIWPISQPTASAAASAVLVPSGNRRTAGSSPASRAARRNRSSPRATPSPDLPPLGRLPCERRSDLGRQLLQQGAGPLHRGLWAEALGEGE